jgi:lipid A 4'-phosphatase
MTHYRRFYELIIVLLLAILTTLVFWLTDWDYRLASIFYHPEKIGDVWPLQH